jgi:Putative zinc-finger
MMSCHAATRMLSDSQDRQLNLKERMSLRFHTAMCTACRRFGNHMNIIRMAMRRDVTGVRSDKRR